MPVVQAKLRIGAPSDKYKQEADSIAQQGADRVANEIDLPQIKGQVRLFSRMAIVAQVLQMVSRSRVALLVLNLRINDKSDFWETSRQALRWQ